MRYKISELEDQLIATLRADTTNFPASEVRIDTYAGQIDSRMFTDPAYMQGFVQLLPFVLISYQGRATRERGDRDSAAQTYIHTVYFRVFVGSKSLRTTQEAARGCYDLMAGVYDDLHGRVPLSTPQQMPNLPRLSGTTITTSEFNCVGPVFEAGGRDESLVINLPGIVVYQSDYSLRQLA